MSLTYFDELWRQSEVNLEKQKGHWDARAEEFNKYRNQTAAERTTELMDFFTEQQITLDKMDILDIGCGTGQLSLELANQSNSVTGLDISTQMIQYAKQNAKSKNIANANFHELPWEYIDLDSLDWNKKYDLVVSHMTPAISSRQSLEKMMEASRGYCFMSGYLERHERVRDEIEQNILRRKPRIPDHGRGIYCSFNILWLHGIHPEIAYNSMERKSDRTVEEAFAYYCTHLEMKTALTVGEQQDIRKYLEEIAQNGRVKDTAKSKTAWLFWNSTIDTRGAVL